MLTHREPVSVTIANQPKTVTASSNSTIQQVLYAPGNDQPIACLKTGQDPEHLTDEDGTKCDPQIALNVPITTPTNAPVMLRTVNAGGTIQVDVLGSLSLTQLCDRNNNEDHNRGEMTYLNSRLY